MRGIARRGAVGATVVLTALALGGCTTVTSLTSTPTITDLPSRTDEITPRRRPRAPAPPRAPLVRATGRPGSANRGRREPNGPAPGGLQSTERLVILEDLGVAFAVPTLFAEVDPERLADAALGSPELKEAAERVGMSLAQLRNGMVNQMDRLYAGAGENGFPTTVIAGRMPMRGSPPTPPCASSSARARHGHRPPRRREDGGRSGVWRPTRSRWVTGSHGQIGLVDTGDGVVSDRDRRFA